MRRKVQFLVTCCLAVCFMLGGCSQSELPLESPALASADESTYEPAEIVEEDESEEVYEEEAVEEELEVEEEVEDEELHGIIALIGNYGGIDSLNETFNIIAIDPETGKIKPIYTFSVPLYPFEVDGDIWLYALTDTYSVLGNYRDMFSLNFDKLAMTLHHKSGEKNMGWLDSDSNFINATELLANDSQSDFYELPHHIATRFEDGCLIYINRISGEQSYLKVPESNLSREAVTDYSGPETIRMVGAKDRMATDWIDETNCIVTYYSQSQAYCERYNVETGQLSSFIPETSRCNWSGVLSPDGANVAFLSMPSSTSGDAEIFTVPLDGGEPTKINLSSSLQSMYGNINMIRKHTTAETYCYLLDWLE